MIQAECQLYKRVYQATHRVFHSVFHVLEDPLHPDRLFYPFLSLTVS